MTIFDIETGSLPASDLAWQMPEFEARANLKDPDKIAADLAEKKAKWIEKAALEATTGMVLAIGILNGDEKQIISGKEPKMLEAFWKLYGSGADSWVGFNIFFFDLPTPEAQQAIWKSFMEKYQLPAQPLPAHVGWTGAEIENCCELAWALDTTLRDAAAYIVPISKAAPERIERLRRECDMRFISASREGVYMHPSGKSQPPTGDMGGQRKIELPN